MALGAGVKLGTLQLDAILNDSFPQTLGGFFSQSTDYVSFAKVIGDLSVLVRNRLAVNGAPARAPRFLCLPVGAVLTDAAPGIPIDRA